MTVIYGLDKAAAGYIIASGGNLNQTIVRQRAHILYQAFAERTAAYNDGAVKVLERSGNNFGRTGSTFIDQYHQRDLGVLRRLSGRRRCHANRAQDS